MDEQNKTTAKLTDKAFCRLVVTSVVGILVCIACLCSSTFAWFTASVPNTGNEIKTATECLLSVTIAENGEALEGENNVYALEADVVYTVTLSLPAGSASGYCLIRTDLSTYYTDYLLGNQPEDQAFSFSLTVAESKSVTLIPRWGIYAGDPDVVADALIEVE